MSAVNKVLDRLDKPKQSAPGRWMCKCPAHEDRGPSLSIRELEDGRVLVHCFAGCGSLDVLTAIGLRMADLFEAPLPGTRNYQNFLTPVRGGFSARELLELNAHEATVAAMLATKAETENLTPEESRRLRQAAARLSTTEGLVRGR